MGLGMGLPVAWACSFLRARNNPSILRRSSCSACERQVSMAVAKIKSE